MAAWSTTNLRHRPAAKASSRRHANSPTMKSNRRIMKCWSLAIIIIYLLRQKAAHNTSQLQRQKKHKKLITKIHKIINYKTNHTANEVVVHASVHNSFLEWLPDMQFDFKVRSGYLYIYVLCIHRIFLQTDSITFALLLTIFYMILMITLTIFNCYINTNNTWN